MKTVYLTVSSWVGVSIGATHTYGRLTCESHKDEVDVQRPITAAEAREQNKRDRAMYGTPSNFWKKGTPTNGFANEQAVVEKALSCWKEHFPGGGVLIKGHRGVLDPMPVLDGPSEFVRRANDIVARCEAIDYWDGGRDKDMRALSKEWEALLREFGVER